ncbi:MAG: DUF2088 domain-containing protein [Desulfobaccales bacterium]|jgi:hypothetical protein
MEYPKFGLVRQKFEKTTFSDPGAMVRRELERSDLLAPIGRGDKVLITAGSRGIESMNEVLRTLIEAVKEHGGEPLLFPAMGSHGRGDAEGQVEVLRHLGITEANLSAPIYSGFDVVEIDRVLDSVPVYADRAAVDADHILIVNRVKEHTEYLGETESGILKMAVVGLGRQPGAETMHKLAVNISYLKAIHLIAASLFQNLKILGGVALLEGHLNQLRRVEAIRPDEVFAREPALLEESKLFKPKLPFQELDILLIDEIGKEISGAGMDTKVVGRIMNIYEKECETPKITRIIVRDLSEATFGNATGIGLADYTTRRAAEKIDFEATAMNCMTAVAPEKGRIPLALASDRGALEAAFKTIGLWTPEGVRVAWIANTKDLEVLAVSSALLEARRGELEVCEEARLFDLPYDASGNLPNLRDLLHKRGMAL